MNKMLEISKNQASIAQMEKETENIKIATKYYTLITEEIDEEVQFKKNEYKKKHRLFTGYMARIKITVHMVALLFCFFKEPPYSSPQSVH